MAIRVPVRSNNQEFIIAPQHHQPPNVSIFAAVLSSTQAQIDSIYGDWEAG